MGETMTYEQLCAAWAADRDLSVSFPCAFYEPALVVKDGEQRWVPGWKAVARRMTWPALVRGLTTFRECASKEQCPGWQPCELSEPRRGKDYVLSVSCLVLDVDDGTGLEAISERFASWAHIVHSTWSSTAEHPKARVVIPLEEPCPVQWFPRLWRWGQSRVSDIADEQTKDASRLYFLPARGPAGHCEAIVHEPGGSLLDPRPWDRLPETPEEKMAREAARKAEEWRKRRDKEPASSPERERAEQLKHDPAAREALGIALGGRVQGGSVKRVKCPSCGRASVWWPIVPAAMYAAQCAHRNSCGWWGWLDGMEVGR